jgi:hypothetical protein
VKIDQIVKRILADEPKTSFAAVKPEWIESAVEQYPDMPADLKHFYTEYGLGGDWR